MKHSPYIGPRPFERGDQSNFYGREREARELQALITAEHEVLVYAQSGAGKTSLFNARVIPALEEQGFDVLPVARVGLDLPPSVDPRGVENIFIYSALLSLAGPQADPLALRSARLSGFLKERLAAAAEAAGAVAESAVAESAVAESAVAESAVAESAVAESAVAESAVAENAVADGAGIEPGWDLEGVPHPPVLVFDQFEELFTTHRERWQEADGFFAQVRAALDEIPELGVVFSMREDHIAALDPYLSHFARRLRARFRLEPLGQRGALAAIARPAEYAGVPFAPGVAERLVEDLCRVKVQSTGQEGTDGTVLGASVEPVQLQVVCSQLWANLPEDTTRIQWNEVSKFGDVDRALTGFYESSVQSVVEQTGIKERAVRRWFREQLITTVGTRGLALRGPEETAGLRNAAVDILEDRHLVRAEARAGARWYEIAHDRLVDPILASNRAWERARQTPLRTAAQRWQETKEKGLLLRGKALEDAALWANQNPGEVEEHELAFIEASRQAERAAARRRQQWMALGIAGAVVVLVMAALTAFAVIMNGKAQRASGEAQAASTEAVAQRNQAEAARQQAEDDRKLAEDAAHRAQTAEELARAEQQQARASELALQASKVVSQSRPQLGMQLALQSTALRQQLGLDSLTAADQAIFDGLQQSSGMLLDGPQGGVLRLAGQGDWLAAAGAEGSIRVWNLAETPLGKTPRTLSGYQGAVYDLAFDPKGGRIAAAGEDGTLRLWPLEGEGEPLVLIRQPEPLRVLAFNANGRWLAAGGDNGLVLLWDLEQDPQGKKPFTLTGDGQPVRALAFQPGSRWLATLGSQDKVVRFWDTAKTDPSNAPLAVRLQPPADMLRFEGTSLDHLIFSPDGRFLSVSGHGYYSFVLDLSGGLVKPAVSPVLFNSGSYSITGAAFSPDGCFLAMQDRKLSQNEINLFLADPNLPPANWQSFRFPAPSGSKVAFLGRGQRHYLVSAGVDNAVRLWDLRLFYQRMTASASCSYNPQSLITNPEVEKVSTAPVVLRGFDGDASALLDLPDQQYLAAAGLDGSVRLWGYQQLGGTLLPRQFTSGSLPQKTFQFDTSADGRWLVTYSGNQQIDVYDLRDMAKAPRTFFLPNTAMVRSVVISPDGRWAFFYMIGKGRGGYMLNLQRQDAQVEPFTIPESEGFSEIAFSPDGRQMAVIFEWHILTVWDLDREDKPALLHGPLNLDPNRDCLASAQMKVGYTPNGRWLVVANASTAPQGSHFLLDVKNLSQPPHSFGPPSTGEEICVREKNAENIAFSPDGRWLAGPGSDGTVYVWDLQPAETGGAVLFRRLRGFDGQVKSLAFSPDGTWLVAGSSDFSLRAWRAADLSAQEEPPSTRLTGHESAVLTVRFNAAGNLLASLSADRTVQLWRVGDSLKPWVRFTGLYSNGQEILFAQMDGVESLLAIRADHALAAWPLDMQKLMTAACEQTRPVLSEDRDAYFPGEDPLAVCPAR